MKIAKKTVHKDFVIRCCKFLHTMTNYSSQANLQYKDGVTLCTTRRNNLQFGNMSRPQLDAEDRKKSECDHVGVRRGPGRPRGRRGGARCRRRPPEDAGGFHVLPPSRRRAPEHCGPGRARPGLPRAVLARRCRGHHRGRGVGTPKGTSAVSRRRPRPGALPARSLVTSAGVVPVAWRSSFVPPVRPGRIFRSPSRKILRYFKSE